MYSRCNTCSSDDLFPCVSVMASFIQTPQNQSVLLYSTATFSCVANNVQSVTYLVNSMPIYAVASLGVIQSSPLTSGSQTTVYLTIPGTSAFNNSQVMCLTFLADGTRYDSPPAYLLVTAPGMCRDQCSTILIYWVSTNKRNALKSL